MAQTNELQKLKEENSLLKKDLSSACNDLAVLESQNLHLKIKVEYLEKKFKESNENAARYESICLRMLEKFVFGGEKP